MGEIVGAALVAHVPTIMASEEERFEMNEGREISLVPGLHRMRAEVLDPLDIDTFVVLDSHWHTTVEFVVTSHLEQSGRFTSSELPRGMSQIPYRFEGDPDLAHAVAALSEPLQDMWITAIDDPYLPVTYATVNLLNYLQRPERAERWVSFSNCQTADAFDFLHAGRLLGEAIAASDLRVMLLASGAMSHSFHPLRVIRQHESSDPSHIFSPEAREFDQQILRWWADGDHASVVAAYPEYLRHKPEAHFGHYLTMLGAIGGSDCKSVGVPFSDYENSVGTAQIHVNFARPDGGWTTSG